MKNREIAAIFDEMAHILEKKKDNPFKVRAYRRASLTLESLGRPVEELNREELHALPGIGDELAAKIMEYCATGAIHAHEKLRKEALEAVQEQEAESGTKKGSGGPDPT